MSKPFLPLEISPVQGAFPAGSLLPALLCLLGQCHRVKPWHPRWPQYMGASPGTFISLITVNSFNPSALERWEVLQSRWKTGEERLIQEKCKQMPWVGRRFCSGISCPAAHQAIPVWKKIIQLENFWRSLPFLFQPQSLGTVFDDTGISRRGLKNLENIWYKFSCFPAMQLLHRHHIEGSERKKSIVALPECLIIESKDHVGWTRPHCVQPFNQKAVQGGVSSAALSRGGSFCSLWAQRGPGMV